MAPSDVFRIAENVAFEDFVDGGLIFRFSDRHFFELNVTARDILLRMDGARSVADIAVILAGEYGTAEKMLVADICELTRHLAQQGIIQPCVSVASHKKEF